MEHFAGTLGIDLGSVNVKVAWLSEEQTPLEAAPVAWTPARGRTFQALEELLTTSMASHIDGRPLCLSVTGIAQDLMRGLVPSVQTNEVVATATAVARSFPGTRTIIDVGGQFTKWILLDSDQVADFALNGLCAAGSGAFLEQQAARLGLTAAELGRLASTASRGAAVAGRCSVFAKSDMIHLQQKGTPVEEIAFGVCLALARTFAATVLNGRPVEPPLALVGGGAANPGLVRALRQVLGLAPEEIFIPEGYQTIGALGAALAAGECQPTRLEAVLETLRRRARTSSSRTELGGLPPLEPWAEPVEAPDEDPPRRAPGPIKVYLGVDVGSVSTNVVLIDHSSGEVLQGIYLPTRGRPIDVLDQALDLVKAKYGDDLEVLALGSTGSGRHLAARALGADTVINEITAQMTSAARYFPKVDTVFEIGGQDSKYIGAREGRLAGFEMNKICAAGTGSFLEEQAERLGVRIKGDFSEQALEAPRPHDLGSRCTVFMDMELVSAQQRGVPLGDICAGLAYSIARNYLDKVVARRPIGDTVVFQGGTASNQSVVAAMRALTGKRIVVHPYNRISGAIGAALLAARDIARTPRPSRFRGYDACHGATTRSFECKKCTNRCQVTRVSVGGTISHFGDTCERYSERDGREQGPGVRDQGSGKGRDPRQTDQSLWSMLSIFGRGQGRGKDHSTSRERSNLFAEREALLKQHMPPRRPGRPRVILPLASHHLELAPFWATAFEELGYDVSLTPPSSPELIELGSAGLPAEVCLPIKVAAGHARTALAEPADLVLFPSVLELPDRTGDGATHTCFYSQELPHLLALEGQGEGRLMIPQCSLSTSRGGVREVVQELVRLLGVAPRRAWYAARRGLAAQRGFERARATLGRQALEKLGDRAVVILGRPYNLHDPLLNLDLARRLGQLGLPAIPMDLMPLEDVRLGRRYDRIMWRYTRDQLRALELIRQRPGLFPLWVTSFGCGLDAFAFKHLEEHLARKPSLTLEFDEHRGEAGLVTRLEAFLDEIDEHLTHPSLHARPRRPKPSPPSLSGRFVIPHISEHAFAAAATFRAAGFDAQVLPPPDDQTVKLGEAHSTGGECHPWVIMAGELIRWATSDQTLRGDVFYYPQAINPCLIGQYGDGHRALLSRLGLDDRLQVFAFPGVGLANQLGGPAALHMYEGIAAMDLLISAACHVRPYERRPGAVGKVHWENVHLVCETLASGKRALPAMKQAIEQLMAVPRRDDERPRPLVGVCGDLYTSTSPIGNANLFARLEELGCEVWAHPSLSNLIDAGSRFNFEHWVNRGQLGRSALEYLASFATWNRSKPLRQMLPPELARIALDPPPLETRRRAARYLGQRSNNILIDPVAKMVDFAEGGADGIINAVGLGCMMGTIADGVMRRMRQDYPDLPMVTLAYGCTEGPSQRVKLETFVHQVHQRARRSRSENTQ
jgi:predicted CoA-substrate-specific enzyme activase